MDEFDKKAREKGFIDYEDMLYYECTGMLEECDEYRDDENEN